MNIFYITLFYFIFNCFGDTANPIANINGSVKLAFVTACIFPTLAVFYKKYWIKKKINIENYIKDDLYRLKNDNKIEDNSLVKVNLLKKKYLDYKQLQNDTMLIVYDKEPILQDSKSLFINKSSIKINLFDNNLSISTKILEKENYENYVGVKNFIFNEQDIILEIYQIYKQRYDSICDELSRKFNISFPDFDQSFLDGTPSSLIRYNQCLKNKHAFFKSIKINKLPLIQHSENNKSFEIYQDLKNNFQICFRNLLMFFAINIDNYTPMQVLEAIYNNIDFLEELNKKEQWREENRALSSKIKDYLNIKEKIDIFNYLPFFGFIRINTMPEIILNVLSIYIMLILLIMNFQKNAAVNPYLLVDLGLVCGFR